MPFYNKVMLMGHLTRDPEMKFLPSNTAVANFGLAINRKWTDQQGNKKDETCFVDCVAFGKQAETINQYVKKGDPFFIDGRLKLDQWEDKQGGKRSKLSVVVEGFQFIRSGDGGGQKQAVGQEEMEF